VTSVQSSTVHAHRARRLGAGVQKTDRSGFIFNPVVGAMHLPADIDLAGGVDWEPVAPQWLDSAAQFAHVPPLQTRTGHPARTGAQRHTAPVRKRSKDKDGQADNRATSVAF
jgi:hypothetical protein